MLTIKAPIELKCNIAMVPSQEAFYHRITGNYELFSSQITGEDLLHMVTEPAQVYFGEGDMTSIVQSTHIQNSQETKLEIINNLLNRIVMNSDVQLTYQDRVYITDVLRKLGIQNVQQFMNQVNRLKQETNNLEEQVSFYWSNMEELTQIAKESSYSENLSGQTINQQNVSQKYSFEEIISHLQENEEYDVNELQQIDVQKLEQYIQQIDQFKKEAGNIEEQVNYYQNNMEKLTQIAKGDSYLENLVRQITEQQNVSRNSSYEEIISYLHENDVYNASELQQTDIQNLEQFLQQLNELKKEAVNIEEQVNYNQSSMEKLTQIAKGNSYLENLVRQIVNRQNVSRNSSYEEIITYLHENNAYNAVELRQTDIQNLEQYLQQLNELKKEATNIQEQVNSYHQSSMEKLTQIAEENSYSENLSTQTINQQNVIQKQLHEEIMNRLQTGAIYQILNNFYGNYNGSSYHVNAQELQITEQKRTATNILLNQLQNFTGSEEIPFVFRHDNYYESMYMDEQNLTQDAVNNRITSAVLLNLIDNLYLNRFEKKMQNEDVWVNMGDSLYQTAENTLKRVYNYIENPQHRYFPVNFTEVSMRYSQSETDEEEKADFIKEQIAKNIDAEIYYTQQNIENQYPVQEIREKGSSEETEGTRDGAVQITEEMLRTVSNYIDNSQTYVNGSNSTEMTTIQLPEGEEETEERIEVHRESVPDYIEELTRINQQNIENYNRYQKIISEQQKERQKSQKRQAPEERMRRESLMALHNPAQLFEEYQEEAKAQEAQKNVQLQELTKIIPEQTRKIYEQLEEYRMRTISQPGNTIRNDIGVLMQDIRMVENQEKIQEEQSSVYTDKVRELSEIVQTKQQQTEVYLQQKGLRKEGAIQPEAPLIHKTRDSYLDEEVIEQLLEQNRMLKNNISISERVEEDRQVTNTKTVHQVQQNVIKETQDISDIVQKSMQRQIGSISDQVYSKLEKRLQNEKKRRGY